MTPVHEKGREAWAATRWSRALGLSLALALAAGCASRAASPFGRSATTDEPIVIEVRNDNYLDVTVHLMPDGSWRRLGTVTGASTATFEAARTMLPGTGGFRLMVSPIGSREAYLSEEIFAMPGDIVRLRVAAVLHMSSWSVRRE